MENSPVKDAVAALGGTTKVAALLGISSQAVSQWRQVPAHHVAAIVAASKGQLTCHQLRPDIFPREDAA